MRLLTRGTAFAFNSAEYDLPADVESPWIVLEYLPHGDLKSFLVKNPRPVAVLVKYMMDVAMGVHYLSERGLIHRDLAARNVLVSVM